MTDTGTDTGTTTGPDAVETVAVHPSAVYQELLDRNVFALPTCADCARAHYSPRTLCPYCGSTALGWREASGRGTVYSTSTLSRRGRDPYCVVLVDLEEGPRVMSNVVGTPPDEVRIGAVVHVEVGERDGVAVPLFRVVAP